MNSYFVTGTGTEVGKTVVSALLVKALGAKYWKPVQCGELDTEAVKVLAGVDDGRILPACYTLRGYLSPNHAAAEEGIEIDSEKLTLPKGEHGRCIVEGAGGVRVPFNDQFSVIDLIKTLSFPAIIVCRGALGTINYTLLTIEALRSRGIGVRGVVFSGELNVANQKTIERLGAVETLFHLPQVMKVSTRVIEQWEKELGDEIRKKL